MLFAVTAAGMTANALVTPSVPEILRGVGVGTQYAGLFVASTALPAIPFSPVLGLLADRYGRRDTLLASAVLFGVSGGLAAAAPSFATLVALRALQGLGSVGMVNLVVILLADRADGGERARLIGVNSAVQTVCTVAFPFVGGLLTDLAGWRAPFALYPLTLAAVPAIALLMPRDSGRKVDWRQQARETWPVLSTRRNTALLGASCVVFLLIGGAVWTILPLHLDQRFAVGPTVRGLLLSIPALGAVAVAPNLHRLHRALGHRRVLVAASLTLALSLLLLAVAPGLEVIAVALVLSGIATGATVPTLQDLAASTGPLVTRGAVMTTMVSSARLGQAVGPIAAGAALAPAGRTYSLLAAVVVAVTVLPPLMRATTAPAPAT